MCIIYYSNLVNYNWNNLEKNIDILTDCEIEKLHELRYLKDKKIFLGSRILLNLLIFNLKHQNYNLFGIKYTDWGKPYIPNINIDFNISHSEDISVCGISLSSRIGVDIEVIREISIEDYKIVLTIQEYYWIKTSENSLELFYKVWTVKEAILKAEGKGFYMPPENIEVLHNHTDLKKEVRLGTRTWYIYQTTISLQDNYCLAIALADKHDITLQEIDLS